MSTFICSLLDVLKSPVTPVTVCKALFCSYFSILGPGGSPVKHGNMASVLDL